MCGQEVINLQRHFWRSEGLLHRQGGLEVGYRGVESGQVQTVM